MSNVQIAGHYPGFVNGTILTNGTLSEEIPIMDFEMVGLHVGSGWVNGTIGFQVADKSDADGGTYVDLLASNGAAVAVGPVSGGFAISGDVLKPLAPYHYVKVKSSIAQDGAVIRIVLKA